VKPTDRPIYRLTIAAPPGKVPEICRLRAFLKRLGRSYDLRCIDIEELPPEVVSKPHKGQSRGKGARRIDLSIIPHKALWI
jgi:hypothetical protein